ncbi:MAG: hypothetical protein HN534_06215 [Euryarchaeota archaeon]|nr:hypothetical protein [Euryarchaeota archaeon]MBT3654505.1 hypothetical protein [Euryarchaeota archaeon]MBT3757676.1 hypothetical protein [Euryarchaeota archaeon]MBT4050528.1 hypothetical protein [Euryarchaeota archaeon]MBT4346174.1 hypothetical protein [Euryarchaeota archaeon]
MSTETKEGMFSDLEELSHSEVKDLVKDVDIMVRSFEQEHHDLRDERKNQITLVKSMRLAVGEIEEGNQERKKLLQRFHSARKSSETARNNRDAVNKAVPPPVSILKEWLGETHQRLVTINNDLTSVPTLNREIEMFKRFFEIQASVVRKYDSEKFHSEYVKHIESIREITSELDKTRKSISSKPKQSDVEEEYNPSHSDVRKISKRITNIDKKLDSLYSEIKEQKKQLKRLRSYVNITRGRGKPIKIAEVKTRAQSGGSLNAAELGALLNSGGLTELTREESSKTLESKPNKSNSKKPRRKFGVARRGARHGNLATRREE